MEIEIINCPQCGGALEEVTESGFYVCPYCKSKMKVTLSEPDPNLRPDGRTTIFDSNTGNELCYIKLASGWTASGTIVHEMQSANWPFSMHIHAASQDGTVLIYYRSGASYKEVISSNVMRHVEGGFDQTEKMPMRRLQSAALYADGFISEDAAKGTMVSLWEERPFSKTPPEDFEAKRSELYQSTLSRIRAMTPPGMSASVDKSIYEGCTRIYSFEEDGNEIRQAVTTIVNGVQISLGAPMMFFGGTSSYFFWDVPYVLTLKANADIFEENYENLVMFCSSMQASPMLFQMITQERQNILGAMQQHQEDAFQQHQKIMQEQQASFDAYNQAWFASSNRMHNASRSASAARQSSGDRISDMYSEANRGVNTYIRPDGTEVEYSVVNEAAFANVNDSHDTFATQSKDFASCDWVEMKKKY